MLKVLPAELRCPQARSSGQWFQPQGDLRQRGAEGKVGEASAKACKGEEGRGQASTQLREGGGDGGEMIVLDPETHPIELSAFSIIVLRGCVRICVSTGWYFF